MKFCAHRNVILATISLMTAGCSNSIGMLKSGDPHVCAQNDVRKQLFEILKQHFYNPISESDVADFKVDPSGWLKKINLNIDAISSTSVDKDNQKIDCNGTVHFSAENVSRETWAKVNYEVSPDLSSDKIVVSADTSASMSALSQMVALVAQPDIAQPLKDKADAEKKRNDAIMANEHAHSPMEINFPELPQDDMDTDKTSFTYLCQKGKPFLGMPCVTVDKSIIKTGQNDFIQDNMDPALINAVPPKPKDFSLIYTYITSYNKANLRVHFQDSVIDYNLGVGDNVYVWTTTHDGGKTWSNLQASNPRNF
jgi:hypothetical protein